MNDNIISILNEDNELSEVFYGELNSETKPQSELIGMATNTIDRKDEIIKCLLPFYLKSIGDGSKTIELSEEKCKYCDSEYTVDGESGWPLLEYAGDVISIFNGRLELRSLVEKEMKYYTKDWITIEKCPKCGKKILGVVKHED